MTQLQGVLVGVQLLCITILLAAIYIGMGGRKP